MKIKIAVISDIHSPGSMENPELRGELAENLLLRAINRFNRWIKPDVAIICGDIVDGNDEPIARENLVKIRQILDKLSCPYIAVRGNHDPSADYFYKIFENKEQFDIKGYRFLTFDDPEESLFCASRTAAELNRFKIARANFGGPIISVQHVPIFPPGLSECPYKYTNAQQIIDEMKKNKIFLSISGHYHKGFDIIHSDGLNFAAAPAICKSPFSYMIIDAEDENVSSAMDCFQMPPEFGLVDHHVHTQLAFCSENMDIASVMKLYKDFGLAGVVFTEHTGQLYFDNNSFWNGDCYINGLDKVNDKNNRMEQYFDLVHKNNISINSIGLEVDFDYTGRAMIKPQDKARAGFFLGSIHKLAELHKQSGTWPTVKQEYLSRTEAAVKSGINVLAHPFRLFYRAGSTPPKELYEKVIKLLKENNVAAEMNFHSQETESEFVEMCINSGVKLCLSSDSHNLYEVGELWPHLQLLKKTGVSDKDLSKVLL